MRVVVGCVTRWLWRAVNEHGEVLDVLLQEHRDTGAAKRFFRRLVDDYELPERIISDTRFGARVGSGVMVQHSGSCPSLVRVSTLPSQQKSGRTI